MHAAVEIGMESPRIPPVIRGPPAALAGERGKLHPCVALRPLWLGGLFTGDVDERHRPGATWNPRIGR